MLIFSFNAQTTPGAFRSAIFLAANKPAATTNDRVEPRGTAPAPGAVFRAPAENPSGPETFEGSWPFRAQTADRGARSATPGAGVLPMPTHWDSWWNGMIPAQCANRESMA